MACYYYCLGAAAAAGGEHEHYSIGLWKCKKTRMKIAMSGSNRKLHCFSASRNTMATTSSDSNGGYNDSKKRPSDMVTFSSKISTEVPLYEPPGVSFNEYIKDRPRIFEAMFPDKSRSQRLNNEEWRIQMLPLRFLFASVNPVVDMRLRCKAQGKGYPSDVPIHVTRILELEATRWELNGLEGISMPSHFDLNVRGVLYSVRRGSRSYLNGNLDMSISLVLPPALALVPMDVLKAVAETVRLLFFEHLTFDDKFLSMQVAQVLTSLVEKMRHEVHAGLLSDFSTYGREMIGKHCQPTTLPASAATILDADPQNLDADPQTPQHQP